MKTTRSLIGVFWMLFVITGDLWAAPTVMEIMKKMEDIEFIGSDVIVRMTFTRQKKDEGVKVVESVFYRRDQDDSFLMVMTAPENEKGNGYLRVGDNMWMYRRNSRTFQKMSRYQSIANSDIRASDMEKRKFTQLYDPILDKNGKEVVVEETLGKAEIPVYRIEVQAKIKDLEYPKMIYWVKRDDFLLMKHQSYSGSGTLMTTGYYPKYTTVNGKYIPVLMKFVNDFEPGNQTMLELSGISMKGIDNDVFTKAYLENLSK